MMVPNFLTVAQTAAVMETVIRVVTQSRITRLVLVAMFARNRQVTISRTFVKQSSALSVSIWSTRKITEVACCARSLNSPLRHLQTEIIPQLQQGPRKSSLMTTWFRTALT